MTFYPCFRLVAFSILDVLSRYTSLVTIALLLLLLWISESSFDSTNLLTHAVLIILMSHFLCGPRNRMLQPVRGEGYEPNKLELMQ